MPVIDRLERLRWLPDARLFCLLYSGNEGAVEIHSSLESIELQLAEDDDGEERDWPAIEPILRSIELPVTVTDAWLSERQASLGEELETAE
jgi:hypothetical protein